jgi:hypothetical protein
MGKIETIQQSQLSLIHMIEAKSLLMVAVNQPAESQMKIFTMESHHSKH